MNFKQILFKSFIAINNAKQIISDLIKFRISGDVFIRNNDKTTKLSFIYLTKSTLVIVLNNLKEIGE